MKATVKTLTPVHIGNGVTYNKGIDFIQKDGLIGIVDERKILERLGQDNIKQWITAIENFNPDTDFRKQPLLDLLDKRGIVINNIAEISSRVSRLIDKNNSSSQLKEHFRSGLKGMEIPGSSIKGSIRTCILDKLIDDKHYEFDIRDIKSEKMNRQTGNLNVDWKFDIVDNKVFGDTANDKSTRFIHTGDVHFETTVPEVYEVRILNLLGDEWVFKRGQQFLVEAIPADVVSSCNFKLDQKLLELNSNNYPGKWPKSKTGFLNNGVPGFCSVINSVTASLIEWELDVLEDQSMGNEGEFMLDGYERILEIIEKCDRNEFVIRVGANSGWVFMTAGWWRRFTDDFTEKEMSLIRKKIQKKDYTLMDIWPKTRKITTSGQIFGFIKVTLN